MLSDAELLGCFESLGDNCELGVVQRFVGIEPLGLFRLSSSKMPALLRVLDTDFAGVGSPNSLSLFIEANNTYGVQVNGYEFRYHTEQPIADVTPEQLVAQQSKALAFLARKLSADIAAGEKIFVRRGDDSRLLEDIEPLLAQLRRRGPATLLWVVHEDAMHRSGTVEVLRDGLLKGYLDRLAPYAYAHQVSVGWPALCRNAYRLWRDHSPPGTVRADQVPPPSNLILFADRCEGPRWAALPTAISRTLSFDDPTAPRLDPASAIVEHTLQCDADQATKNLYRHLALGFPNPGDSYVVSMYVWLPADFEGSMVRAHCAGFTRLRQKPVDLRRRECWQRIAAFCGAPDPVTASMVVLQVIGRAGARLYSTRWQLERGTMLRPYTSGVLKPVPGAGPLGRAAAAAGPPTAR